ncbi:hypothetical protein RIF29_29933 [Crotalaria pallida]|uniref:Uncharacterized protein n=1 Tax=Crotalaria pallida TaxID=3830 RepID=A0AAN9EFP1_CROPI
MVLPLVISRFNCCHDLPGLMNQVCKEVVVKRFLDEDIFGESLEEFKSESYFWLFVLAGMGSGDWFKTLLGKSKGGI